MTSPPSPQATGDKSDNARDSSPDNENGGSVLRKPPPKTDATEKYIAGGEATAAHQTDMTAPSSVMQFTAAQEFRTGNPLVAPASQDVRAHEIEDGKTILPPASHAVSLHLSDGPGSVDIRMAERAGEIRVTVHTPSHELANSLRSDLPELVGKLRLNGFHAETWRPEPVAQSAPTRRNGSDTGAFQQNSPGDRRDERQQSTPRPKDRSRWDGEWKSSLDPAEELYK